MPETLIFSFAKLIDFYRTDMTNDDKDVTAFMKTATVSEILANTKLWDEDLTRMYEAFQDIIDENDNWEAWTKRFDGDAKVYNKKLKKLKTLKEKKALWESIVNYRDYTPACEFKSFHFSYKLREVGLKLFGEHFQELWW